MTSSIDPQEFARAIRYAGGMARQVKSGRASAPLAIEQTFLTPTAGAKGVETVLTLLQGRWKLLILFQLFGGKLRRFSELERDIPAVSQKMLTQQLRQLERDGIVRRIVHPQVPPKVEYGLTDWGQALCPVLDALLKWAASQATVQPPTTGTGQFAR